jgi:RNA polymerase-binding transcription factor DksA
MVAHIASTRDGGPAVAPRLDVFRALLLSELEQRTTQATESRATAAGLVGQGDSDSLLERELAESAAKLADEAAAEIRAALDRIELGTYGRCQRCQGAIAPERLEAIPHARLCVTCT